MLYELAKSKNIWKKRMAIMATFAFIRRNDFSDTFLLAQILLKDKHYLIHKAAGWMLREIGKRDKKAEEIFLKKYAAEMPRIMLGYAIERFSPKERKIYLQST